MVNTRNTVNLKVFSDPQKDILCLDVQHNVQNSPLSSLTFPVQRTHEAVVDITDVSWHTRPSLVKQQLQESAVLETLEKRASSVHCAEHSNNNTVNGH